MMTLKFFPNDKGNPPGKLADAELHFDSGPFASLKLIGFGIWERKNARPRVTFPARQCIRQRRAAILPCCSDPSRTRPTPRTFVT